MKRGILTLFWVVVMAYVSVFIVSTFTSKSVNVHKMKGIKLDLAQSKKVENIFVEGVHVSIVHSAPLTKGKDCMIKMAYFDEEKNLLKSFFQVMESGKSENDEVEDMVITVNCERRPTGNVATIFFKVGEREFPRQNKKGIEKHRDNKLQI